MLLFSLFLLSSRGFIASAFVVNPSLKTLSFFNLNHHAVAGTDQSLYARGTTAVFASSIPIETELVETEQSMMNVAALRNDCRDHLLMIEQQEAKRDSFDKNKSLFEGLGVGAAMGVLAGGIAYIQGQSIEKALQEFAVFAVAVGGSIGYNNYSGGRVFVMTEAAAINRLRVDYIEGLLRGGDMAMVARTKNLKFEDGRYQPTNGVVGCIDWQLRNLNKSEAKKKYGKYPYHAHFKNMLVDEGVRRQGIGSKLLNAAEKYLRSKTDIELMTLEVDDKNIAAVKLYEAAGFSRDGAASTFGRSIMVKWF